MSENVFISACDARLDVMVGSGRTAREQEQSTEHHHAKAGGALKPVQLRRGSPGGQRAQYRVERNRDRLEEEKNGAKEGIALEIGIDLNKLREKRREDQNGLWITHGHKPLSPESAAQVHSALRQITGLH